MFPFGNCGLCRPQRRTAPAAAAAPLADSPLAAAHVPPGAVAQMLRSKSEARILHSDSGELKAVAGMSRCQSMPSSNLLEAARKRLAAAAASEVAAKAARQLAEDGAAAKEFVQKYMAAIKDGNGSWASAPEVGSLFTEDARMVAADKQSFFGRPAIVRRLNQGVEALAKMAGDQPELPTFELSGPEPAAGGGAAGAADGSGSAVVLRLALKRGMHRMTFTMTFTLREGKIAQLVNARS